MWLRQAPLVFLLACGTLNAFSDQAGSPIGKVKSDVEKWVETRQLIGRERRDWIADKESLEQSIALYEKRVSALDADIAEASESNAQAIKERAEVEAEKANLLKAAETARRLIGEMERRLRTDQALMPAPLRDKLDELMRRLPEDPDDTKMSLSQRLPTLVGIIAEVEKFNGSISIFSELRKNAQGAEVQVKTIYLGLGQAYFVDKSGTYAGVGAPGAEGWQWTDRSELAQSVADVIGVYENSKPAAFVDLPVAID